MPKSVPPINARLCRVLAYAAAGARGMFLVTNLVLWLVPNWIPFVARSQAGLQLETITITPTVQSLSIAASTLYLTVLARALWQARRLFQGLAEGRVFEPQTGVLMRSFGVGLVAYAAVTPFFGTLITWLVTMQNTTQHGRILRFGISEYETVLAIVGTMVMTTGSVMAEAARMAEENRQIV